MKKRYSSSSQSKRICTVITVLLVIFLFRPTVYATTQKMITLTLSNGQVYPISPNDTLIVGKIVFSKKSTLQNNGTIIFNDANGTSDFSISTNSNGDQGTISILNYGKIECKNCTLTNPDPTKETFILKIMEQ